VKIVLNNIDVARASERIRVLAERYGIAHAALLGSRA
jgi:hypothetical protein